MSGSSTIFVTDARRALLDEKHGLRDPDKAGHLNSGIAAHASFETKQHSNPTIKYQHLQAIEEKADLNILPKAREKIDPKETSIEITLGDLHGNALKLIYFLIREGMLELKKDTDYEELVRIYHLDPYKLEKKDLTSFNKILANARIKHIGKVRLIGDELCDRGSNDYFTLKIIEKLRFNEVPLEILLSNHSVEFLRVCENPPVDKKHHDSFTPPPTLNSWQLASSLYNLQDLIDRKLVTRREILNIANDSYKSCIKALGYTLSPDKKSITIHSHAPIGINTIQHLAKKCNVEFNDSSAPALAMTIDNINAHVKKHIKNGEFSKLLNKKAMDAGYDILNNPPIEQDKHPFEFLMWNRDHDKTIERPHEHKSYFINNTLGHDIDEDYISPSHVHNLDNILGKSTEYHQGTYTVIRSICPPQALNQTYKLIAELRNEALKHRSSSLKKAALDVAKEASALAMKLTSQDEITNLSYCVMHSIKVIRNERSFTTNQLRNLSKYNMPSLSEDAKGEPNNWKKFMGALSILAGVALICFGALGTPFTGGASLVAGMYIGGSLLAAGGAALFYHGRQKGISKAFENFADELEKPALK